MADNEIYDFEEAEGDPPPEELGPQPLYRIYEGSRIVVGKGVGDMWRKRLDASRKAYEMITSVWQAVFEHYNFHHRKTMSTPKGVFRAGDGTENVVYSNLNIILPAIYGKDPDVTCSTTDEQDEPFCRAMEALINALFRRKTSLNAKQKIKKAAGITLLTNYGVLKIDWTKKDDSREMAIAEMEALSIDLGNAKDAKAAEEIYGRLEALEQNLEVLKPSGPSMANVLPQNLIIDPNAEMPDGYDAEWMIEKLFISTASLTQRFTKPDPENEGEKEADRVLVYKPTHKASFTSNTRDDGVGLVLEHVQASTEEVTSHQEDERAAYVGMYYTECYMVWDKIMKRVMLFHRDDWKWPIWVWDDPLKISRFFPYFIIGYSMSTGGTVAPGEYAYILDQQDEINEMNRQLSRIRTSMFNYFMYDTDRMNKDDAEKFINSLRGEVPAQKHILGVQAQGAKINELLTAVDIPLGDNAELVFNKPAVLDTINRITNTSDALRGVQFKTNTNVAAVNTYQESMRLSIGAKVDVVEDVVGDIALAMAELCVQNWDVQTVAGYIGEKLAEGWQQMSVEQFLATYSLTIAAGSMEKPNSVFKKKEAIEVAQAVGQFATAAPGASLRIMLRVLEQAFTEVVIKPEDWEAIDAEIQANLTKGVSTAEGGAPPPEASGEPSGGDFMKKAQNLPPAQKAQVLQMSQSGMPPEQIAAYIREQVGAGQTRQ